MISAKKIIFGPVGFGISKLVLQASIFIHLHIVTKYFSASMGKDWIDAFALASILTIALSGERHLSLKFKDKNVSQQNELDSYITYSIFLSAACFVVAITMPFNLFWKALFAITACEVIYSDQLRLYLINGAFKKAIILNLSRSIAHLSTLFIAIYPDKFAVSPYALIPYLLTNCILIAYAVHRDKSITFPRVVSGFRRYNCGFTSSAIISRAPYVADKVIINNRLLVDASANYTLISGAAAAVVGVFDSFYFQPKLKQIIESNSDLASIVTVAINYIFLGSIFFVLFGFVCVMYVNSINGVLLLAIMMVLLLLAYLNLMLHAYIHTLKKRYFPISVNAIGSVLLFYVGTQFYVNDLLGFSIIYLFIIICVTKFTHFFWESDRS